MDSAKVELSAKSPTNNVSASYKAIPESDMEEDAVTRPKSLVKPKANSLEVDGAHEKMLPNEKANSEKVDMVDLKLSPIDKQNGDAKLDICDLKTAFVGLTKEELMKYANDPFWIRLRWFLFITFWLLWAAMLAGAVLIIYFAPKCNPPPPRTWWEQGPLVEVDSGVNLEQLKSLKDKGVQGIIINWPEDTYASVNDTDDFVKLLQKAAKEGINTIVELEPGTSKIWFNKSEQKDPQVSDYYIWKQSQNINIDGKPAPPNNWLTKQNTSSWIYSADRKEFYYAPNGLPQLNFRNSNVTQELTDVIVKFLEYGAHGIRLRGVPYLLADAKFENELIKSGPSKFVLTDYGFYQHTKTENLMELGPLLQQWRLIVKNKTENGAFMSADELNNIDAYKVNTSLVIDLPIQSQIFTRPNLNATDIFKSINSVFSADGNVWPLWKYNSSGGVLDIVTFLLPGAPMIKEDAPLNTELLKIRSSASVMRGNFTYHKVANETVFAYIRVTSGNPGVLVAFNPTDNRVVVDFPAEIPAVSEEVTVQLFSSNYNETDVAYNVKQDAHTIPISPKAAIVLSYVPKVA